MTICFTVTNDLSYDQRMIRICSSLSAAGYTVILTGRKMLGSVPLTPMPYQQKRIPCFFNKGKLFYLEFNLRLFCWLFFVKTDCICAIDLDTIFPCYLVSKWRKKKRVYDAHELFCEMKEIVTRPRIYRFWKWIEQKTVPHFNNGYTVNQPIADEFNIMYGVHYAVIKNVPLLQETVTGHTAEKFFIYQGAVNEARCFEVLIPAMKMINAPLLIYGTGNFIEQAKQLAIEYEVTDKVIFKGNVAPAALIHITANAFAGINLVENTGLSNYLSLANKFFDYIHAEIPQLCSGYPAYKQINKEFEVAVLIDDLSPENIARSLNNLLADELLYQRLKANCAKAKQVYNWQEEEKTLVNFYRKILG